MKKIELLPKFFLLLGNPGTGMAIYYLYSNHMGDSLLSDIIFVAMAFFSVFCFISYVGFAVQRERDIAVESLTQALYSIAYAEKEEDE